MEDPRGWLVIFALWGLIALGMGIIPGIIATRRKHPYAVFIWLLALVGSLFTAGLGWVAALVWAFIPPKNGVSYSVPTVSTTYPEAPNQKTKTSVPTTANVEGDLAELQRLLDTKQISQKEYDALRKKTLGL